MISHTTSALRDFRKKVLTPPYFKSDATIYSFLLFISFCIASSQLDNCGTCRLKRGNHFCLEYSGLCLKCSEDCPNNDYPPCGDICEAFKTTSPYNVTLSPSKSSQATPTVAGLASDNTTIQAVSLFPTNSTMPAHPTTLGTECCNKVTVAVSCLLTSVVTLIVLVVGIAAYRKLKGRRLLPPWCRRSTGGEGGLANGDVQEMRPLH